MDGKFTYAKKNENPPECHNFSCEECWSVFRDESELRNHDSNHKMEFYRCLQCMKIFCSMRSFENHNKSHSFFYTCEICNKTFQLNKECLCTVCGKLFQMPTIMRGHRIKQHGHTEDIVPGHPESCKRKHASSVKKPLQYLSSKPKPVKQHNPKP